ncbi:MAG: hypothetical protein PHW08_12290 [Kiritimatiellae bacterium]|nr:hypothetical protein [Kiritimatiellia bacterium]
MKMCQLAPVIMAGVLVSCVTQCAAQAEYRIWTSITGGKLQARILNLDGGYANFEGTSGSTYKIKLTGLVEADREYIDDNFVFKPWSETIEKLFAERIENAKRKKLNGDTDGWREELKIVDRFVNENRDSLSYLEKHCCSDPVKRHLSWRAAELLVKSYWYENNAFSEVDWGRRSSERAINVVAKEEQAVRVGEQQTVDVQPSGSIGGSLVTQSIRDGWNADGSINYFDPMRRKSVAPQRNVGDTSDDGQLTAEGERDRVRLLEVEQVRSDRHQKQLVQKNSGDSFGSGYENFGAGRMDNSYPKNKDPSAVWNDFARKNDPTAPHNTESGRGDPSKPWNQIGGGNNDLNQEERKAYGLPDNSYPKNKDPFTAWNDPIRKNDTFAPHNDPIDGRNSFKPWNQPFGNNDDLNAKERKAYGLTERNSRR